MATVSTRSTEMSKRIEELEKETESLSLAQREQVLELARLKDQQQQLLMGPPSQPPPITSMVQVGVQPLRLPNIDRFSGSREDSAAFIRAVDNRLMATGQLDQFAGLEWAVSFLAGYALNWYMSYVRTTPVTSWSGLRTAFEREFGMIDEQKVLEARLLDLKQTGSFDEYVTEFLSIEVRLTDQSDGFKQRTFLRHSNAYLRDRFADREFASLSELVTAALRLKNVVEASKFSPDELLIPVVAAMPAARPRQGRRGKGAPIVCFRCDLAGHKKTDCKVRLGNDGKPTPRTGARSSSRVVPVKEKARFGKYDGSGRVYAVEACDEFDEYEEMSDDELREGNDLA